VNRWRCRARQASSSPALKSLPRSITTRQSQSLLPRCTHRGSEELIGQDKHRRLVLLGRLNARSRTQILLDGAGAITAGQTRPAKRSGQTAGRPVRCAWQTGGGAPRCPSAHQRTSHMPPPKASTITKSPPSGNHRRTREIRAMASTRRRSRLPRAWHHANGCSCLAIHSMIEVAGHGIREIKRHPPPGSRAKAWFPLITSAEALFRPGGASTRSQGILFLATGRRPGHAQVPATTSSPLRLKFARLHRPTLERIATTPAAAPSAAVWHHPSPFSLAMSTKGTGSCGPCRRARRRHLQARIIDIPPPSTLS